MPNYWRPNYGRLNHIDPTMAIWAGQGILGTIPTPRAEVMKVQFQCPICNAMTDKTICDRCASSIRRYITEKQFEEILDERK